MIRVPAAAAKNTRTVTAKVYNRKNGPTMGYKEEKQHQLDMRYLRMARIWATPVRNHPGVRRTTKVPSRGGDSGKDKIGTRGSAAKLQPKGTKRATKNREQDKEAAELRRTTKVPSR